MTTQKKAPVSLATEGANQDQTILNDLLENYNKLGASLESLILKVPEKRGAPDLLDGFPSVGSIVDVAEFLNLPEAAVRELCRTKKLKSLKASGKWRIPREWLREFMEAGGENVAV